MNGGNISFLRGNITFFDAVNHKRIELQDVKAIFVIFQDPGSLDMYLSFGNVIVSHFMNIHVRVFNMSKVPFSSYNFQFQIQKQRCPLCISNPNCEQN